MPRTQQPPNGAPEPPKTKRASSTKKASSPSPDEVARRAYEIYQFRGANHGADFDDWLEAERQLSQTVAPPKEKMPKKKTRANGAA